MRITRFVDAAPTPTPYIGVAMMRTGTDIGRCTSCGGRVAATHMLTKTYRLDAAGAWQRRFDDFVEDVVVVCAGCGIEPEGSFQGDGTSFMFVPAASDPDTAA